MINRDNHRNVVDLSGYTLTKTKPFFSNFDRSEKDQISYENSAR